MLLRLEIYVFTHARSQILDKCTHMNIYIYIYMYVCLGNWFAVRFAGAPGKIGKFSGVLARVSIICKCSGIDKCFLGFRDVFLILEKFLQFKRSCLESRQVSSEFNQGHWNLAKSPNV